MTYMGVIVFLGLIVLFASFFTVKQATAAIVERLGKFHSVRHAGLHLKIPFIDQVAKRMNLRIQQLDVMIDTKTLDNVFLKMKVSVQYQVIKEQVADAFYKLESPDNQITSYVFDVVRAEVPKMKLDDVFVRKDDIAIAVKGELQEAMQSYGYDIIKALVTDIDPDEQVKHAMNRINAAERERTAAEYESEAQKIRIVAVAKAEAESKKLQGQGIADQRREIAKGLEESVKMLNAANINAQEASALIVVTQHYDTLQSIGANNRSNLVLLPNSPNSASTMLNDLMVSMAATQKMDDLAKK
ncbi:MAG TPA: SPFH domain-containing protein [Kaistella sp.]|jgi:Membrane protease subunits, stomatin/prohibitin homologs|uniref:SPFH domain-containing protein n=1 Tax=Candidatus Kaistella beijingensis TaxID=2820270 RepID=UPI0019DF8700|nr:SPFH domain-containing protein [Candidatus Kaistella beijingensis]MBE2274307.1 SPFH domain-containing protein [Flavobacteriales bacterium]MCA0391855.1 SPFH domain-containing protein [Bacteroidota bacterium]HPZ25321.1 SPFH domain-containing protein [Kaistella sp.]MBN8623540.1 SPFH domain-containing protein [Flavobacteriales bacterium]UBB89904.1 SPFH domain-containing protein [Candidatus Kaistella beijingensis]